MPLVNLSKENLQLIYFKKGGNFQNEGQIDSAQVNYEKSILVMDFLKEFWEFLKVRKKYWLLPILLVLVLFGGLIVLSQGSAIAPFIYTLF